MSCKLTINDDVIPVIPLIELQGSEDEGGEETVPSESDEPEDETVQDTDAVTVNTDWVVVIDPGHGGWDPGTGNGGIYEAELNLELALRLRSVLEARGCIVYCTRTEDVALADEKDNDLVARMWYAKSHGAKVFLSIHQNSVEDTSVNGFEVHYNSKNTVGADRLAAIIDEHMSNGITGISDRGVYKSDTLRVLGYTDLASVLIECGYMTNQSDFDIICSESYREQFVISVANAIIEFLSSDTTEAAVTEETATEETVIEETVTEEITEEESEASNEVH